MYAGATHADSSDYQPRIVLWNYALHSIYNNLMISYAGTCMLALLMLTLVITSLV